MNQEELIEAVIKPATFHSPIFGKPDTYLYSTISIKLPVPGGSKVVTLRRKVVAESGADQNNEQMGAYRYFANTIQFLASGSADNLEQEVYADDDETFDLAIGKFEIKIDKTRIAEPILQYQGTIPYVELRDVAT